MKSTSTSTSTSTTDTTTAAATAVRRARFGKLPERIRYEEMVEERAAGSSDPTRYAYDPEGSWKSFSCLALDLGL
ncbi:hypothetical protein OOK12_00530 [Streptomyces sp. NBC_00452]|uniref:hypothetical protein n=1 Tax=Streptomyces sp. NBC_00452 TaxID=2975746 RepID=UPI00225C2F91|nr:hypothetical protein [Streptomyces sp. NBC_00452]MCX5055558.1 hypothetical protein [Streptomyces sp. NBC_00452]